MKTVIYTYQSSTNTAKTVDVSYNEFSGCVFIRELKNGNPISNWISASKKYWKDLTACNYECIRTR